MIPSHTQGSMQQKWTDNQCIFKLEKTPTTEVHVTETGGTMLTDTGGHRKIKLQPKFRRARQTDNEHNSRRGSAGLW